MPLLERDESLTVLRAGQEMAAAGHGRVVVVSGEAGAGKTALVRHALEASAWGYCEPLGTPRPLGPFRDIAAALWPVPPSRPNALSMADRLLRQLQQPGPALVVEDAHWIDTSSSQVVRFLGRRIRDTCGLLVVITRDELPADAALLTVLGDLAATGSMTRITVPPLSAGGVRELSGGTGLDLDTVMRLTGGNAFLVTQLATAPTGRPAASLRESMAARVAQLPPGSRPVLELLAVMPGRVPGQLIGDDWRHIDELVDAGLLRVNGNTVEFRHELVRLAVEEAIPGGRRGAVHQQVLQRLTHASNSEPAQIAHHARHAHRADIALAAEVDAARRAAAFGSHHEAVAHYRRAVDDARMSAPPATYVRLLLRLAQQESAVAHDDPARRAAERAVQVSATLDDPLLHSAAARVMSRLEPVEQRADELALVAVALCEGRGASRELAAAYANLATNRMLARRLGDAIAHAHQATDLAREVGDFDSEVIAANALGSALLLQGDPGGEIPLRRAMHLAAAHGDEPEVGRAYANLVSASGEARMYALSSTAAREAMRYFAARDLDAMASYTQAWKARCLFEQGSWNGAGSELAQLSSSERPQGPITRLMVLYLTARLSSRRGDPDPTGSLDEAEEFAARTGSLQRLAPVAAARAEKQWLGDASMDVSQLLHTYQLALARSDSWTIGELGLWLWRFGEIETLPDTAAAPYRLQVAGDLRAAADAWSAFGCPYEAAEALADSADEEDLRRALDMFGHLGATPQWRRTAHRLREIGARSVPRGPRRDEGRRPDGLTTREAEILDWLGRGHTDSEIGAHLHLSVRTVEHHVAAILRKKEVTSRRDLQQR